MAGTPFGTQCNGQLCSDRLDLTGTGLELVATDWFSIFLTGSYARSYTSLSEVVAVGTVAPVSPVPLPGAALLFGSALLGTLGLKRRKAVLKG